MDINTLLCNDENKNDNDVEMKDAEYGDNKMSSNLPMLPELEIRKTSFESTNPILYSSMATSNSTNAMANDDIPNMNSLSITSPTSPPSTSPMNSLIPSKLDTLSGIAAATAALRQRKHVRNSPRARKSVLSGSGPGSPGSTHYPYATSVGSSRHRLLAPVTPQAPPSHPISSAILRRNRIQNGIRNVVRGVSDTLFTHQNQNQNQNQSNTNSNNNNESNSNSTSNFSAHNIFGHINRNGNGNGNNNNNNNNSNNGMPPNSQPSGQPPLPETILNQDDVNHGIKCCLQWLKYAITHLDQEINLLRNIANESFHVIQNRNNPNGENNSSNDGSSNSNPSNNSNNGNGSGIITPFHFGAGQISNVHRKSLMEIKRDIVFTIRKTVEIIIKGASKYLPGESRLIIRRFILSLPSRLSKITQRVKPPETITGTTSAVNGPKMMDTESSVTSSPVSSYMADETDPLKMSNNNNNNNKENNGSMNSLNATKEESLKIMTLATEGNDMLKKMMDVFEKSFEKNNKNNLDNINLINTNENSSLNYSTNKILYNPMNNNKLGNNLNNRNTPPINNNSNYIINDPMNYNNSMNNSSNINTNTNNS